MNESARPRGPVRIPQPSRAASESPRPQCRFRCPGQVGRYWGQAFCQVTPRLRPGRMCAESTADGRGIWENQVGRRIQSRPGNAQDERCLWSGADNTDPRPVCLTEPEMNVTRTEGGRRRNTDPPTCSRAGASHQDWPDTGGKRAWGRPWQSTLHDPAKRSFGWSDRSGRTGQHRSRQESHRWRYSRRAQIDPKSGAKNPVSSAHSPAGSMRTQETEGWGKDRQYAHAPLPWQWQPTQPPCVPRPVIRCTNRKARRGKTNVETVMQAIN